MAQPTPTPKSDPLWRAVLAGWWDILTNPGRDSIKRHTAHASLLKTALGVGVLGFILGLWATISGLRLLGFDIHPPWIAFLFYFSLTEAAFFALSLVVYLCARVFGGWGDFIPHAYILSLVTVPLAVFALVFLSLARALGLTLTAILNPFSDLNLALIVIVLFAFYALLLLLAALQAALQLTSQGALYALGSTVGVVGLFQSIALAPTLQGNVVFRVVEFIVQQWQRGLLQESILGHFWLIFFAVAVAVVIGVIMGILISLSPQRPQLIHLFFLIPIALFFLLWAFSSGLFGEQVAAQIADTVSQWQRAMRVAGGGYFASLLTILGAIVRKPAAVGVLGMAIALIFYVLLLFGERASDLTLYIAGIILTIPSIAMFGILIEPLGIGGFNAAFALVMYAQLPILRNTYTGIREVEPEIVEAGRGMGMTEFQLLRQVRFPMAVPVIFTGVRVSIVMLVGIAAIAAYIGVSTLGDYIFTGIARAQEQRYLTGAIVVAVLALVVDYVLEKLEAWLTPEGLSGRQEAGRRAV